MAHVKELTTTWGAELKRHKGAWDNAERSTRDAWEAEKTKEVKVGSVTSVTSCDVTQLRRILLASSCTKSLHARNQDLQAAAFLSHL